MPKLIVTCETCGSELKRVPSAVRDHNYCDMACRNVGLKILNAGPRSPAWSHVDKIVALYVREERTLENIAAIVDATPPTVSAILEANGIPRRPGGLPPRLPRPEPRSCAYEGCDVEFTPTPSQAARGDGHYHSYRCRNLATTRPRTAGAYVICPVCGRSRWYWASDIARGNRFCSASCWGRYRWKHGLLADWWLARPLSGVTRQRWIGRWEGRRFGALGGRPRASVSDTQRDEIQKLSDQGWGRRAIASRLLLSERAVRNALDKP
jgi:hypothetical protein